MSTAAIHVSGKLQKFVLYKCKCCGRSFTGLHQLHIWDSTTLDHALEQLNQMPVSRIPDGWAQNGRGNYQCPDCIK